MRATRRGALPSDIESFTLKNTPGHLLRRCHQRSEELFAAALGADGPTRQQVALLVTVCQHPEASQAELVELTGIDKNTLAQMVRRLTERGLLERRRTAEDGRTNAISATRAAVKLLEQSMPAVKNVQKEILAAVPPELRETFQHCLRLIAGIEEE